MTTAIATDPPDVQGPPIDLDAPLTVEQAAEYLQVKPDTLHIWRRDEKGPECSMLGSDAKTVRYTMRDLIAFNESRKVKRKTRKKSA